MIPVSLELHNFLAYRDPEPLNLEGVHIVCLAGENGAGKSSLLDAITWALWGRARTASADDLVHQGQTDMAVTLIFDYAGNRYRVIRQRRTGKRTGASLLEFQVQDDGRWRSLSEATLRGTEKKIVDLLRLDYDTFVNSAFLLQGKADEFTTRTPAARKQVLANILGLAQWEVYEERAREKIRILTGQIQQVEGRLQEIERELDRRAEYTAELAAAETEAAAIAARLAAAEQEWADLEKARAEVIAAQKQIDELTRRIVAGEKELAETDAALSAARPKADAEAYGRELEHASAQLAALEQSESRREELAGQRQAAAEENAALRGENEMLGPQTEPLKKRVETLQIATEPVCPTCGQPLGEDHRHQLVAELQAEVEARRERYRQNAAHMRALAAQIAEQDRELNRLAAELRQRPILQGRLAALNSALAGAAEAREQLQGLTRRRERWAAAVAEDR
ncbi:MAG: SMC family ATPase, partial [Chloroflexi bacterium]|nr:SMC family ATPase [Chloroflexota bacterium]